MKNFYKSMIALAMMFAALPSLAQSPVITMTTSKYYSFSFQLLAIVEDTPVQVDWGDGNLVNFTVATTWTEIKPSGYLTVPATIKVYGSGIKGLVSDHNDLTELDVANVHDLQYLSCLANQLDSLDVSGNNNLTSLSCGANKLVSLSLNPGLQDLYCFTNNLTTLDLSVAPNLSSVNCSMNPLKTLDLSGNPDLENLWCWENQLTELDVSNNLHLNEINCRSNQLVSLDVKNNLVRLDCSDNQLTSLKATVYDNLICNGNQLDTLALGITPRVVHCQNNLLKSISLGAYSTLNELICDHNKLTTLNLNGQIDLQKLDCNTNYLTELDLSDNPNLVELDCSSNLMDIMTLPNMRPTFVNYNYQPQYDILANVAGYKIDLSRQLDADDINGVSRETVYGWRTSSGKLLTNGIDYTQANGLFTFLKALAEPVYCEMNNPAFPELKLRSGFVQPYELIFDRKAIIPSGVMVMRDGTSLTEEDIVRTGDNLTITAIAPPGFSIKRFNVNGTEFSNGGSYVVSDKDVVISVEYAENRIVTFPEPVTVLRRDIPLNSSDIVQMGDTLEIVINAGDAFIEYFRLNGVAITSGETCIVGIDDIAITASILQPSMVVKVSEPGPFWFYLKAKAENTYIKIDAGTNVLVADTIGINYKWIRYDLTAPASNIKIFGEGITGFELQYQSVTVLDVSSNSDLEELFCVENEITTLNVSGNPALKVLRCNQNQITELDISSCAALEILDCSMNQLSALNVSQNASLTNLNCAMNQLSSLDLSSLAGLMELDCGGNNLTLLNVAGNTELTSVDCSMNQLTALNLSSLFSLEDLYCSDNNLTLLDVSANPALITLDCGGNLLASIDISMNLALENLGCDSNLLTTLDVRQHSALEGLSCINNPLGTIDISANTKLRYLLCDKTRLTELDLSSNPLLQYLTCSDNQLSSLDLNGKNDLQYLVCNQNLLTTLDLSGNPKLYLVSVKGNLLTNLDLSNNPDVSYLNCEENFLDLKAIPQIRVEDPDGFKYGEFTYSPQEELPVIPKMNVIDLNRQLTISDVDGISNTTGYTWKIKDGTNLIAGMAYEEVDGVFTFPKAPTDSFYCEMQNEALPDLVLATKMLAPSSLAYHCILNIPPNVTVICNEKALNDGDTALTNDQLTISAITPDGFTFENLFVNEAPFQSGAVFIAGDQDVTIAVDFKTNYGLTIPDHVSVSRGGTPLSETDVILEGDQLTIEANTPLGHTFDGLLVNNTPFIPGNTLAVASGDVIIEVFFTPVDYTITIPQYITVTRGGNGISNSDPVHIGDTLAITANPPAGSAIIIFDVNGIAFTSGEKYIVQAEDVMINFKSLFPIVVESAKIGSLDFMVSAIMDNSPIYFDSGNGSLISYTIGTSPVFISLYQSTPQTIKIYGSGINYLNVSSFELSKLDVSANPELRILNCAFNQLTTLDLSANLELEKLYCGYNQLTALDLGANSKLTELTCPHNRIADIDLSLLIDLKILNVDDNELTALNVAASSMLDRLYCSRNQLTSLDVSANTRLNSINCESNQLTALDLSANRRLDDIYCGYNQLTALDLSSNMLRALFCESNQLQYLDVSTQENLQDLNCSGNQLTTLDISANIQLSILFCSNNRLSTVKVGESQTLMMVECENNILDYMELSKLRPSDRFGYSPQSAFEVNPIGAVVNLSRQDSVKDRYDASQKTIFTWKTVQGALLVEGEDFSREGAVFTFLKIPSSAVFCQMTNPVYPGLVLRTKEIPASSFIFDCILSIPENVVVTRNEVVVNHGEIVRTGDLLVITAIPKPRHSISSLTVNGTTFTSGQTYAITYEDVSIEIEFTMLTPVESPQIADVKVYPNPFTDKVYVEIPGGRVLSITFVDLSGNVVFETEYNAGGADVSLLKSGAYIARIVTSEGIVLKKIFKI